MVQGEEDVKLNPNGIKSDPDLKWQKYPSHDPHMREIWTESVEIEREGANWPFRKVMVQNEILSQNQGKWQLNSR